MKVGIDISQVAYEGTGSARYVVELVRAMVSIPTELQFSLFGSALRKNRSITEFLLTLSANNFDSKIYRFPPKFFEILWNKLHFVDFELFAGEVDIYHSSDWTQAPSKSTKVTTVHDLIPFLFPEYVDPRIIEAHKARWKWITREVDHLIVDAECTKQDIINRFGFEVNRISVIPLGVDIRFLEIGKIKSNENDELKSDHQVKLSNVLEKFTIEEGKFVLAVGTLEPRKNIKKLVEAFGRLSKDVRDSLTLVIVGKKAWAESVEIPQNTKVIFTGYVDDADLPYLFGGARLFVMPSIYEGFGLPVLEAMSTFTPVLASRRSSIGEIGGDTINYIEEPNELESIEKSLTEALSEPINRNLNQNAYQRACIYNWEKTAKETINVYNSLCKDK